MRHGKIFIFQGLGCSENYIIIQILVHTHCKISLWYIWIVNRVSSLKGLENFYKWQILCWTFKCSPRRTNQNHYWVIDAKWCVIDYQSHYLMPKPWSGILSLKVQCTPEFTSIFRWLGCQLPWPQLGTKTAFTLEQMYQTQHKELGKKKKDINSKQYSPHWHTLYVVSGITSFHFEVLMRCL